MRCELVPAGQILQSGGAKDAPAVQGRVRRAAAHAAPSVDVVRRRPNDAVRLLDGLRVGVDA